jgi:hypothetical protein
MTQNDFVVITGKIQPHKNCGYCGKPVKAYKNSRKCDGWHWHRKCWTTFLTAGR